MKKKELLAHLPIWTLVAPITGWLFFAGEKFDLGFIFLLCQGFALIAAVLAAEVDIIMLDNFSLEDLRKGVELIDGKCVVEASGGVNLDKVADIAKTGVDVISIGALTHSARALDLGLDVKIN